MKKHEANDPVSVYIREVCNVVPLTKDEQQKLFRELGTESDWNDAQENVARRLIESQLALVVSIAQKHSASALPMLDLIQQGNLGLMDAVRSFAKKPTGDFSAHAATCIEKAINSEHLLLGLLSTDQGLARRFLSSPWAAEEVWEKIKQSRPVHKPIQGPIDLPLSGVSKRVLSYAADEADRLSSKHIGTEHLLLGLLREEGCFGADFLHQHGVRLASTREELTRIP